MFFDGKQELGLAEDQRHIIAHTLKYPVYEFWRCVFEDPHRIAAIAETLFADLKDENIFAILQEQWPSYKDPYIRSALFLSLTGVRKMDIFPSAKWMLADITHFRWLI